MLWLSKKNILMFLSLAFGALVILGAAKITGVFGTKSSLENNESVWESALSVIPGMTALTRVEKGRIEAEKAFLATTTTDIVARKIFEYSLSQNEKTASEMSETEATKIAKRLIGEVKLPEKKEYQLSDLNVSKDNSYNANLLYINTLSALLKGFVATGQKETELSILFTAINTKNPADLDQLKAKIVIYEELIKNLLALKTPSNIASLHLRLLQSYETMRSGTVGLQSLFNDPAIGLAALTEYKSGFDELFLAEQAYRTFKFAN